MHRLTLIRMDYGAILNVCAVAEYDPIVVAAQYTVEPHTRPYAKPNASDHAGAGSDIVFIASRLNFLVTEGINHSISAGK
jgi:hypothetical protein